ncbi:MAG: efflux transporter outer membrane subunit [Bacteroides sp.]|nr:efflux transporter outer membrane subunit [Bacteroides sp.]MCM1380090.1 efflux transporter outer membrane subunit [Bacteroides sp.]MCM1445677.1 efflux transporter outer membrane subunit [Prevotella sp.]
MKTHILTLATVGLLSLLGQAQQPEVPLPERWNYTEYFDQTVPTDDSWWKTFQDPVLDSLIAIGVDRNYDVVTAAKRIELARLALQQTRSGYYPTLGLNAGWSKTREPGPINESAFDLGLTMSWQIDVFGRVYTASKAKKAAQKVAVADYAGAMVTLCGNIATGYFNLLANRLQLQVAMTHLESQHKVLDITKARFECGLASDLDVEQARTVYSSTEAVIPSLRSSIHAEVNALALLLATEPAEIERLTADGQALPSHVQIIQTGVPMDLLRRRPDVVAAEQSVAEYAAELGVAKKDFLPTLSLNASVGTESSRPNRLFHSGTLTYSIAPTLSWTIFDGLSRNANVKSAKENMLIAIDEYNFTLQQAVNEADNAMFAYVHTLERIASLQAAAEASKKSVELALDLYKQGLSTFTNVADAQINYLTYTNEVILARADALNNLVSIYEALGGGFNN